MLKRLPIYTYVVVISVFVTLSPVNFAEELQNPGMVLEEIIVTAQKREQSLQEAPIAISVLGSEQLDVQMISNLGALAEGVIPSLRVLPLASMSSNLVMSIRGNGPADATEVTREASVAVYLDGIYLGRTQGLDMELADLQRIEVMRGPQGTLFGRNAVGGAVSLITKKPSGEFDIKQTIGSGTFNEFRSVTRINFPEIGGISTKFDYLHSERDGWVENTAASESDFSEYEKDGGRLSFRWQPGSNLIVDYVYDQSKDESTHSYFQLYEDNLFGYNSGLIGIERDRRSKTRRSVLPLKPGVVDQRGHSVTVSWDLSQQLAFKSLSSSRDMEEEVNNNFAGVMYYNGLNFSSLTDNKQFSQEFQLIGTNDHLNWVSGIYYYDEEVDHSQQNYFTLDIFGLLTGTPFSPIIPQTTFDVFMGADSPRRFIDAEAKSKAIYGQVVWTPDILDDRLQLTTGLRYTEDERSGTRIEIDTDTFALATNHTDFSIAIGYALSEDLSSYFKWGTAYKGGGVNSKSASFIPYDEELAETFEVGLKSEFWARRARLNLAIFTTDYEDMQLDFADPVNPTIVESINAENTVEVDGVEMELTVLPIEGLVVGLNYSYLDSHMPLQPNPLAGGALKEFHIPQAPRHAGSLLLDYTFSLYDLGSLIFHMDITSTDQYSYLFQGDQHRDGYTLLNVGVTLADINIGKNAGILRLSIWGKNLTDEEYVIYSFTVGEPATTKPQAFGDPRTAGISITYDL